MKVWLCLIFLSSPPFELIFSITCSEECAAPCAMLTLASIAVWKMFVFHNHLSPIGLSWSSAGVRKMMIYLPIISGTLKCCSTLRHAVPNVCFSLRLALLLHAFYRWQVACMLAGNMGILMKFNWAAHASHRWHSLLLDTLRKFTRHKTFYLPLEIQQ